MADERQATALDLPTSTTTFESGDGDTATGVNSNNTAENNNTMDSADDAKAMVGVGEDGGITGEKVHATAGSGHQRKTKTGQCP